MSKDYHNLSLKSTLNELNLIDLSIDCNEAVHKTQLLLTSYPNLPGIIVLKNQKYFNIISRKIFFEYLSKPFRRDLYFTEPIEILIEAMHLGKSFILPSEMQIIDAITLVFEKDKFNIDEPIGVKYENGLVKLLDVFELIIASSILNKIAINELQIANELKTEFLSIAAHDLKNPLNLINHITFLLIKDSKANLSINIDSLENIKQISESMIDLINELLNTSVIESGKITLNKQIFDFSEIINTVVYQNQKYANKKNQKIKFIYDDNLIYSLNADALKIKEMLENLISNAIKYSVYNTEIIIKLDIIKDKIVFKIIDSGPGLTDEDLIKIFGKFQRLSAKPTGGESSTGLGLYIVKQIVELHNGKISVENNMDKGSTFIVEFTLYNYN